MQVFDYHDHRQKVAPGFQQLLQQLARMQADQQTVESCQRALRDFKSE